MLIDVSGCSWNFILTYFSAHSMCIYIYMALVFVGELALNGTGCIASMCLPTIYFFKSSSFALLEKAHHNKTIQMLHKQMPSGSTWFIFCNPIVHSSLSNRKHPFAGMIKFDLNEFRRVSHTKIPHNFIGSMDQLWRLYDKEPFDLGQKKEQWVDPTQYTYVLVSSSSSSSSSSQLRRGFVDTSRWNLQSRDLHWSLPNQSGS